MNQLMTFTYTNNLVVLSNVSSTSILSVYEWFQCTGCKPEYKLLNGSEVLEISLEKKNLVFKKLMHFLVLLSSNYTIWQRKKDAQEIPCSNEKLG